MWCLAVAAIAMACMSRRHACAAFLLAGLTIKGQIVIGGAHLMVSRLLLLVGGPRMLRYHFSHPRFTPLDKALLAWALANAATYSILWRDPAAVFNRLGFLYSVLGTYFLMRYFLQTEADVMSAIRTLALLSIVVAGFMMHEHMTGKNSFSIFGTQALSEVRDGRVRARGPFDHPIIAGTFGAMLMPLFVGMWLRDPSSGKAAVAGLTGSALITFASASSTPIMAVLGGGVALCCWHQRHSMRRLRRAIVVMLVCIQLVMKAPIWFLLARLGGSMGGTGWHRAMLIDQFVHHFGDWWVVGTRDNSSWGLDMWDSINAYVNAGIEGGLLTFGLFLYTLVQAYKTIGVALDRLTGDERATRLVWCIGATLFANTIAFFGIIYFDQSSIAWYLLLAMIAASATFGGACHEEQGKGDRYESERSLGDEASDTEGSPLHFMWRPECQGRAKQI